MPAECQLSPVEIRRLTSSAPERGSGIEITWSDGKKTTAESRALRKHCPCADCKAKEQAKTSLQKSPGLRVISASVNEELDLREIWPVGNYGVGMRWGDGHDAGIYTFSLLYQLSRKE